MSVAEIKLSIPYGAKFTRSPSLSHSQAVDARGLVGRELARVLPLFISCFKTGISEPVFVWSSSISQLSTIFLRRISSPPREQNFKMMTVSYYFKTYPFNQPNKKPDNLSLTIT